MTPFFFALFANTAIALVLVTVILGLKRFQHFLTRHIQNLTALTVGILLYLVFVSFIPELSESIDGHELGLYLLLGILLFYILELVFHWHHCTDLQHEKHCSHSFSSTHEKHGNLMFTGTLLHNAFHGIELFSAFVISTELGIALAIGICLHALPQNIANFIMNHRQIKSVLIAALGGIAGTLAIYPFGTLITAHAHILLGITTGGLLYLALSDILPTLHAHAGTKQKAGCFAYMALGIVLMIAINMALAYGGVTHG